VLVGTKSESMVRAGVSAGGALTARKSIFGHVIKESVHVSANI
jgi:hypothetical protein